MSMEEGMKELGTIQEKGYLMEGRKAL